MKFKIPQKQDTNLLNEHAKSSFNFGLVGKYELYLAIAFLIIGIIVPFLFDTSILIGLPAILIGLFEILKYPNREKRWVRKKEKEKKFNKNIEFEIFDDRLSISFNDEVKTHPFKKMRECLISETGVVFKISYLEYYYISFKSFDEDNLKSKLISHLKDQFDSKKLKEKRPHNKA